MDTGAAHIGLLAKIPTHGDFVRLHSTSAEWRAFDEWIQEGFFLAQQKNVLQDGYAQADGYAFLFTAGSSTSLIGYVHPSQDQIGRKYPIVIAMELEFSQESDALPQYLPVVYAPFLAKARELAIRAASGEIEHRSFVEQIESMGSASWVQSANSYHEFLEKAPLRWLVERHFSDFDDARKYLMFKNVEELIGPLRAGVPPQYTLGFRFPGFESKIPALYVATFWLDVFFRKLGPASVTPCLFWRIGSEVQESRSSVLVFLRPPPPRVLAHIVPHETESDNICDMEQVGLRKLDMAAAALPDVLRPLLDDREITLSELLLRYQ